MGKTGGSHRASSPAGRAGGTMMRRKRMLEQLDEDIREHLDRETQDNMDRGMSPKEARYAALRKFGNVTHVMEQTHEVWNIAWFESMVRELRFAVRMLLKQPGFSLIAALTLGLGIGATSAVFSLIQAALLTPPPYQKPQQLVLIPSVRSDGQKMDSPR